MSFTFGGASISPDGCRQTCPGEKMVECEEQEVVRRYTGAAFIRQNSAAEELSSSSRLATKKVTLLTKRSPLSIHLKWDNPDDRESLKKIKKEEGALKLTDGRIAENIQQTSLTYKFKS